MLNFYRRLLGIRGMGVQCSFQCVPARTVCQLLFEELLAWRGWCGEEDEGET